MREIRRASRMLRSANGGGWAVDIATAPGKPWESIISMGDEQQCVTANRHHDPGVGQTSVNAGDGFRRARRNSLTQAIETGCEQQHGTNPKPDRSRVPAAHRCGIKSRACVQVPDFTARVLIEGRGRPVGPRAQRRHTGCYSARQRAGRPGARYPGTPRRACYPWLKKNPHPSRTKASITG